MTAPSVAGFPHGTANGARRHYRLGEKPCEPCRIAGNAEYRARRGSNPYSPNVAAEYRDPPRNGLPLVPYRWRGQLYPWAVRAIAAAEAVHGRPGDDVREDWQVTR